MATRSNNEFDEILYVRKLNGQFGGFKTSYVRRELNELEREMLTCACCRGLMRSAVSCGDVMTCYNCTDGIMLSSLAPIRMVIDSFDISCPIDKQCNWRGCISGVEEHASICGYSNVHCPLECGDQVFVKDMEQHKRVNAPIADSPVPIVTNSLYISGYMDINKMYVQSFR